MVTCKLTPHSFTFLSLFPHIASCNLQHKKQRKKKKKKKKREREREREPTSMAPQNSNGSDHKVAVSLPSEPKKASNHHHHHLLLLLQSNKDDQMVSQRQFCKTHELDNDQTVSQTKYSKTRRSYDEAAAASPSATINTEASMVEDTGRERLKRHRVEVAGRVWIPDLWGQEELLKDWIDCTAFDASLGNNNIMSARAALVEEGRRANAGGLRIENRC